jgi:hypothetical protein
MHTTKKAKCNFCNGGGGALNPKSPCAACNGRGWNTVSVPAPSCHFCEDTGRIADDSNGVLRVERCHRCEKG